MLTVFLKVFGWLSLIAIICISIPCFGSTGVFLFRIAFGIVIVLALTVFVAMPFWVAYER